MKRTVRERATDWLPILLGIAAVLFVFTNGVLHRSVAFSDLATRMGCTSGEIIVSSESGRFRGATQLSLDTGMYRLTMHTVSDGEGELLVSFFRGAKTVPTSFSIPAGEGNREYVFQTEAEGGNLLIEIEPGKSRSMRIDSLVLYTPPYADGAFCLLFLWGMVCALWLALRRNLLTADNIRLMFFMAAAVLFASLPVFFGGFRFGDDGIFHLARLENLKSALREGQIPARVGGFSYSGFGAATSVFYPDVFLYPFALMRIAGATEVFTVRTLFICIHIASCASMYFTAWRLTKDRNAAACAAVFYTLALYRLSDVYDRFALGEALAMVFLPLFFESLWQALYGDGEILLLGVSAACILLSHMITTLLCAMLTLVICLFNIHCLFGEERWRTLVGGGVLAVGLSLFFLLPFTMYSVSGIGAYDLMRPAVHHTLWISDLFRVRGKHTLGPGMLFLAAMVSAEIIQKIITQGKREPYKDAIIMGWFCLILTVLPLFWRVLGKITNGFSDYVQFPWRFLAFVSAFFAFTGGVFLAGKIGRHTILVSYLLFAMIAWPKTWDLMALEDNLLPGEMVLMNKGYIEYTLPGFREEWQNDASVRTDKNIRTCEVHKRGTMMSLSVDAPEGGVVSLPLFAFDGYAAELNGKRLPVREGSEGRLTVQLPVGAAGNLRVWFAGKRIWRVADGVSLVTWLAVCAYGVWTRKRRMT